MKIKIEKWCDHRSQSIRDGKKNWCVPVLIEKAKDLPVQEMPIQCLDFSQYNGVAGTTMRQFVSNMRAVLDADMSFPIILDEDGWVMDGRHRIARALLEGHETIKFVRFEQNPRADYYGEDGE